MFFSSVKGKKVPPEDNHTFYAFCLNGRDGKEYRWRWFHHWYGWRSHNRRHGGFVVHSNFFLFLFLFLQGDPTIEIQVRWSTPASCNGLLGYVCDANPYVCAQA